MSAARQGRSPRSSRWGGKRGVARVRRVGEVVHGAAVGGGGVGPPPDRPSPYGSTSPTPPQGGSDTPGTRASRPQPYSSMEVAERWCDLAGCQPAFRREPQRQVPRIPTAPPPGTRASRPQPYFLVEVAERRHDLAGCQPVFRREPQGQVPRTPTAPPRERGRPARNLILRWRLRSVGTTLRAGSRPFGVTPQGQVPRIPTAPLPVEPSGGDGQGCAGLWCGRDARVPGGASSTC